MDYVHQHASGGDGSINGFGQAVKNSARMRDAFHAREEILERV
jgi:hypothetical protein